MEGKYLYFSKSIADDSTYDAGDSILYPASSLRAIEPHNTTTLNLWFDHAIVGTAADADTFWEGQTVRKNDLIQLTITAQKHKEVMTSIINAITNPSVSGLITIADQMTAHTIGTTAITGLYINSNITAVAAITRVT